MPGYDLAAWFAAFVPAKTPKPVLDKLREALVKAVDDKAMQEKLLQAGHRAGDEHVRGPQGVCAGRNQEVGRDREGRGHSAGVKTQPGLRSNRSRIMSRGVCASNDARRAGMRSNATGCGVANSIKRL